MKRFLPVLGALVLVGAVVAVVVWQRPGASPELPAARDVVLQYDDGTELWRTGQPETPLVRQVVRELATRGALSLDQIRKTGGAIVVTTIDPKTQSGATAAIREISAQSGAGSLRYSVTAVDAASGAVKAYAPGNDDAVDYAGGVLKESGSAFFPFTAVAALQDGKTLAQAGEADLQRAVKVAQRAGVPEFASIEGTRTKLLDGAGLALRPFDLASAYATFAADGVHRDAHFVRHITDANGATLYQAVATPQPAFDRDAARSKEIAKQVTAALKADPACGGTGLVACRPGVWPLDGASRHAWMAGYTAELAAAVFVGGDQTGGAVDAGLPKAVWGAFLEKLRP